MDGYCLTARSGFFSRGEDITANECSLWLYEKILTLVCVGMQAFQKVLQYEKESTEANEDFDAEILEFLYRNGDANETAARLLDQYGNKILRLAYSYLHNQSDAEDILQETLLRYLQNAPTFAGPTHEKAWLLKVAANLSKNRIEYNRLRETDELEETLVAKDRQDLSFVWEAVKQLPANYRAAIHLFYYEGCSTADIARILDRKESSVRSDLRRGREQLKHILKEAYDFE